MFIVISAVFIALAPYLSFLPMLLLENPVVFAVSALSCFAVAITLCIAVAIFSLVKKVDSKKLALVNMIVKLVHIPAYVFLFLFGLGGIMMVQFLAITIVVFVIDCILVFTSGIFGATSAIRGKKQGYVGDFYMTVLLVGSFVFCLDVVLSVVNYIRISKKQKAARMSLEDVNEF